MVPRQFVMGFQNRADLQIDLLNPVRSDDEFHNMKSVLKPLQVAENYLQDFVCYVNAFSFETKI